MSQKNKSKTARSQYDEAWKEALRMYFDPFMKLGWPAIHEEIDWSKGHEFLEQELLAITTEVEKELRLDKGVIDKLIKVWRKDGEESWVLLHVEVQSHKEGNFPGRMFVYWCKLFNRYRMDVASLAILIDGNKKWRPSTYRRGLWGTVVSMEYPVIKLLDYQERRQELENSDNPFAVIILGQLLAIETRPDEKRLISKYELIRFLCKKNWDRGKIEHILHLLDAMLTLPKHLMLNYYDMVKTLEEEEKVSFITQMEQHWLEQGIEKGVEKGERRILLSQLEDKFKEVPESYHQKLQSADSQTLLKWATKSMYAHTLEEIFAEE